MVKLFFLILSFFIHFSEVKACNCPHHTQAKEGLHKSKNGKIIIDNPTFSILNGADNGAAYCVINNKSNKKDKLMNAYYLTDGIKTIELHTHIIDEKQVARMRKIDFFEIPEEKDGCCGEKKLEPGHDHIMLIGIDKNMNKKTKLTLLLEFQDAGKIEVEFKKQI
jgi:copper(I)-binding protein